MAGKRPERHRPDASVQTDAWVVLFTRHTDGHAAVRSYGRRWATQGSYRDAQAGQDGWDLERVLASLTDPQRVERVVGLWAVGALLQTWVGRQLSQPAAPAPSPRSAASGPPPGG